MTVGWLASRSIDVLVPLCARFVQACIVTLFVGENSVYVVLSEIGHYNPERDTASRPGKRAIHLTH